MSQDPQARAVLKEAVDAVVNSFAKHTHGYGRGILNNSSMIFFRFRSGIIFLVSCGKLPCRLAQISNFGVKGCTVA